MLAEKPSVARDLARFLGAGERGEGCLRGERVVVTWAIGHLVQLPEPAQIEPRWKSWRAELLPMLPQRWPLEIAERTREQFGIVAALLCDPAVERVVCATDAGREGELIFRYIYERAGCTKPVDRLWISSLTPDAIREGFANLRPAAEYDPLGAAARGRSCADWLVGMNLTRAYTIARSERDQIYSVGRVQTPTLAMLVERELAIRAFVPEDYREVVADLRPVRTAPGGEPLPSYEGVYFDPEVERQLRAQKADDALEKARRLPADGVRAEQIAARARTGRASVESIEAKQHRLAPPQLYDLTELQRHANRLFGWSAKRTLDLAQGLYERAKLLSYPRTDARHLSRSVAQTLPAIVRVIAGPYRAQLAPGTGERPLGPRFVDDTKVSDHHAILPTTTPPAGVSLSEDERRLYDLVCRRLLSAWHEDHLYSVTTVISAIASGAEIDRYRTSGTRVDRPGWRVLDPPPPSAKRGGSAATTGASDVDPAGAVLPPGLAAREPLEVLDARAIAKKTRPPRRLTEAALLTAMETAGRTLEDRELSEAMRDTGLGTPATRAAIIETLLDRGYVARDRKSLGATDKGIALIETVHPEVKSPIMTGRWEAELQSIQRGQGSLDGFLRGIERYVSDVVQRVRRDRAGAGSRVAPTRAADRAPAAGRDAASERGPAAAAVSAQGRTARAVARRPAAARPVAGARAGAPAGGVPDAPSWIQWQQAWHVRGPAGLAGTSVRVQRRDGSAAQVQLGEVAEERGAFVIYRVVRSGASARPPLATKPGSSR